MKSLTVCRELRKNGYLSKKEINLEVRYCKRVVPAVARILYLSIIWPVVLLIRLRPEILPLVNIIARHIWIDRAIKLEIEHEQQK